MYYCYGIITFPSLYNSIHLAFYVVSPPTYDLGELQTLKDMNICLHVQLCLNSCVWCTLSHASSTRGCAFVYFTVKYCCHAT